LISGLFFFIFVHSTTTSSRSGPPHYRSITTTLRHTNLGRTQPDGWSYRSKDPFMTTRNNQKRETALFWKGFEPAIPPRELSQTHTLANETNKTVFYMLYLYWNVGRFNYDMLIQGHGVEAEIRLLVIRNLRAGRGGFSAPHPDIFTPSPEKYPVPILKESGWVSVPLSGRHGIFYVHRGSISQPSRT